MPKNKNKPGPKKLEDIQSSDWYKNLPQQEPKTETEVDTAPKDADSEKPDKQTGGPKDPKTGPPSQPPGKKPIGSPPPKPVKVGGGGAENRPMPTPPRRPSGPPTNAGHYYYVKGEGPGRDFGRRIDAFTLWQLLGSVETPLESIRIHGIPYEDYYRSPAATNTLDLTTTYPGLLIGTGYMHPVYEKNENDFQSGFFFDWTTGLPVIPGSTVKGVLRSVFPKTKDDPEIRQEKRAYLSEIIGGILQREIPDPNAFIDELEKEIFLSSGAAYFDAYIRGVPQDPKHKGKVFSEDYITPHKDAFKDPIPLRFLKISPEVTFRFQFRLKTVASGDVELKPGHLKDFFKTILSDFGIGAKRNTGFGALVEETG